MGAIASDDTERFERACQFIIKLGTLTHGYGPQTQRLESCLSRVTKALGYSGVFMTTPTVISFAFKRDDEWWDRIHLAALPPSGFHLAKLAAVGELVEAVEDQKVTLEEASATLDRIDAMPPPYGRLAVAAGYALCGAGFAGFLRGSWWDVAMASVLSVVVFCLVTLTEHASERLAPWVPFVCAFAAGGLAEALAFPLPGLQVFLVTLSAIIYLIPGFTISVGIIELTTRHVVSGLTNLMNGLVCLALLFAGAWAGIGLVGMLEPLHGARDATVSVGLAWIFVLLLAAGLCLVFQTPPRDLPWALAGCAIAYAGVLAGGSAVGANLGNLLGTAAALVHANIWSERTGRPVSIVLLPALMFMVSGSTGFRGLVSMATGDTVLGTQQFAHMFVVGATIGIGLIVGNSIYRPRITL